MSRLLLVVCLLAVAAVMTACGGTSPSSQGPIGEPSTEAVQQDTEEEPVVADLGGDSDELPAFDLEINQQEIVIRVVGNGGKQYKMYINANLELKNLLPSPIEPELDGEVDDFGNYGFRLPQLADGEEFIVRAVFKDAKPGTCYSVGIVHRTNPQKLGCWGSK